MKKLFLISVVCCLFISCSTYLYQVNYNVPLCQNMSLSKTDVVIPKGRYVLLSGKPNSVKRVQYGDMEGFLQTKYLTKTEKISLKDWKYLIFDYSDSTYVFKSKKYGEAYKEPNDTNSNKTNSSEVKSKTASSSGTVYVNGYYRKDGTYVRPHTRSAPKKR